MIRVSMAPEPNQFSSRVRYPGRRFLNGNPHPTKSEWENHSYWRRVLPEMRVLYRGICAYTACWIPHDVNAQSVDHYVAKDIDPGRAYEWDNYRYCNKLMNARKGTFTDVLDPFAVQDDWFVINFPSLLVRPNRDLSQKRRDQVQASIDRLGLNDEDTCLARRNSYVECYCREKISFQHIADDAPFLAKEIERQGLVDSLPAIMQYP